MGRKLSIVDAFWQVLLILTVSFTGLSHAVWADDPPVPERINVSAQSDFLENDIACVDRLDDGRLFCVFNGVDTQHDGKVRVLGNSSSDNGKIWTKPTILIDTKGKADFDPSLVVIGDSVMVTSTTVPPEWQKTITTSETLAVRSEDRGKTWSLPQAIDMGHRYTSGKVHRGIVLRDGTVMFGFTWDKLLEKSPVLPAEADMHGVTAVMLSHDRGKSWRAFGEHRFRSAQESEIPQGCERHHGASVRRTKRWFALHALSHGGIATLRVP